MNNLVI